MQISWQLPLGVLVILAAIVAIFRQIDVRLVLFFAALLLGAIVQQFDVIVRTFLETFSNGQFIVPICTAMGFSYVLRQTECDQHLVRLLMRPLVAARGLLVPGTVLVGFFVNMPVVSQASTALAIGPVIIPILRAARTPAMVIGAALLLGSSIGGELFNPGAPELRTTVNSSNDAAKLAKLEITYTTAHCINRLRPLSVLGLGVALVFFSWKAARLLKTGEALIPATSDPAKQPDLRVNYLKALVPLVPIVLLALFAPGIGVFELPQHWLDVQDGAATRSLFETRLIGAAMLVGVGAALLTSPKQLPHVAESFFAGAGYGFTHIVSIIVAATCFGKGLELIGIAKALTDHLASSPHLLIATAGIASLAFATLCGSGMATAQSLFPFFAGSAIQLGVDPTHVGAVVSLAAAAGRTMSPMAAVNQMCARLTDTNPIDLTRLVAPPLLAAVAAIITAAMMWIPS